MTSQCSHWVAPGHISGLGTDDLAGGSGSSSSVTAEVCWEQSEGGLSVRFPLVSGPRTLAQPRLLPGVPKAPSLSC